MSVADIRDRVRERVERMCKKVSSEMEPPGVFAEWMREFVFEVADIVADEVGGVDDDEPEAMGVGRTRAGVAHPVTPDASKGGDVAPAGSDPAPSPPVSPEIGSVKS